MTPLEQLLLCFAAGIGIFISSACFYLLGQTSIKKELIILKTNPCQVETIMEARELLESGADCDNIEVMDVSGFAIPDDVNEFSIQGNYYNGKGGEIKHYKRNRDGIFKQVTP